LSLAELVLALPPALSPIELDLLLVVVLRLLALRLLVVRLSCPLSLPSLSNQLNLNTKNLEASSVQNKHKAKTRSQGASLGIGSSGVSSVGFNQSKAFIVGGGVKTAGT
jgi:hypothetical protein